MSLSDFAKKKALDFIESIIKQADPEANTNTGSPRRSLFIIPSSLIQSAWFNEADSLRGLNLGNFENISVADMNILAGNLLEERPQGTSATTNLRLYLTNVESFTLDAFPYFFTQDGIEYSPIRTLEFGVEDFINEDGRWYVIVPVTSLQFGVQSVAGEINKFRNLPVEAQSVVNLSDTQGGDGVASNADFFQYLQDSVNDGTPNQIGGIKQYIRDQFPDAADTLVVPAGDARMLRDEVWTSDGINPNLDREGSPFAAHTSVGTIDFDLNFGAAFSASGQFTSDMEGKRIAIDGDEEAFRLILRVVNSQNAIISGPTLEGTVTAEVWGEGPKIRNMADVYLHFPEVEIQSIVVDKRFFLIADGDQSGTVTRIYYSVAPSFSYPSIPGVGKLVANQGTTQETVYNVTASGTDGTGTYIDIDSATINLEDGNPLSLYDMSEISIGTDIEDVPVLYILQVAQLNPFSFETESFISESGPGNYNDPGWYVSNTDPAEVFSSREMKTIKLDTKEGSLAFEEINQEGCRFTDSSVVKYGATEDTTGSNTIRKTGFDWSNSEGREISVSRAPFQLDDDSASDTGIVCTTSGDTLTMTGKDYAWMSNIGGRDDFRAVATGGGSTTINPGEAWLFGDTIEIKSGSFLGTETSVDVILPALGDEPASPSTDDLWWDGDVLKKYNGTSWINEGYTVDAHGVIDELNFESVILSIPATDTIEIQFSDGVPVRLNDGPTVNEPAVVSVTSPSEVGTFNTSPLRVIYATRGDFQTLQDTLEGGEVQLLCKDTLARSFYPSTIEATIRYRGDSSSQEIYTRFVELVNEVTQITDSGENLRLDMSNIVAALNEEGFTDSLDVNFEVRVVNFLPDGEFEVRYINPSEATRQDLAVSITGSPGDDRITLVRVDTTADVPGRGIVRLGGNDPSRQEAIPYEAVIQNEDDTLTFIYRQGWTAIYAHNQWETAVVTKRDYDPSLEFQDGAIIIPANNRPYVKSLVPIRVSL